MNFEGRHFLQFAGEVYASAWTKGGCTLAANRSVISRAYYAAFWAAREALKRRGRSVSEGAGAHQEVIAAFEEFAASGEPACADIADSLYSLRRDRNKADYEFIPGLESEIPQILEQARKLLSDLSSIR